MLQRTNASKTKLDQLYRMRSLDTHLRKFPLFANLPAGIFSAVADFLKERVRLIRVHPGQMIFREDEQADHFYMVRIGFVKVSRHMPGGEEVVNYIGPEEFFGEIGLLARMPEIRKELNISDRRTATCTALDHVDLVRIDGQDFQFLLRAFCAIDPFLPKCRNVSKRCFRGCSRRLTVRTARSTWKPDYADLAPAAGAQSANASPTRIGAVGGVFTAGFDGSLEFACARFGEMHALR